MMRSHDARRPKWAWPARAALLFATVIPAYSPPLRESDSSAEPAREIVGSSEKRSLAKRLSTTYSANLARIRTWSGQVDLEMHENRLKDGKKVTMKATVAFASDELNGTNKTVKKVHEFFEENTQGQRRNLPRPNQALLLKDGTTYSFPTHFHPDSPDTRYLRQLRVGQDQRDLERDCFFPTLQSVNDGAYRGYYTKVFFKALLDASDDSLSQISMTRQGNIVTVVDKLEKGGVLVLSNTRVFDLDRGASLICFEYDGPCIQRREQWDCEHQHVEGIWIPRRIDSAIEAKQDGLAIRKKMVWRNQVLNEEIAGELSPTTLGACRGDQMYDYRTKKLSRIMDKAYPARPEKGLP